MEMTMLLEPMPGFDRLFNRMLSNGGVQSAFVPAADLVVTDDEVSVHMDVPGLRAENVEIELERDVLTVRGERTYPYAAGEGEQAWQAVERGFGRFERSLRVPYGLELVQEGVVGLLRALQRYDRDHGTPFWPYASCGCARPAATGGGADPAGRALGPGAPPAARLKDAYREHLQREGLEPTVADLATSTGLSGEQVGNLLAVERPPRSLDEPLEGEEGELLALGELLDDPLAETDYERR